MGKLIQTRRVLVQVQTLVGIGSVLGCLLFSYNTQATTLNLAKFQSKGQHVLEQAIGRQNIFGPGSVIFRDGAGSIDLEPLYDYASFIYYVSLRPEVTPLKGLKIGFRMLLNGQQDIVLLSPAPIKGQIAISAPGEGIAALVGDAKKEEIESLIKKLRQTSPKGEFSYLEAIAVITFKVSLVDTPRVFGALRKSPSVKSVELNYENYRIPFEFDLVTRVSGVDTIDADKYRRITKQLKDSGLRFTTETTVPRDLQ